MGTPDRAAAGLEQGCRRSRIAAICVAALYVTNESEPNCGAVFCVGWAESRTAGQPVAEICRR